MESSKVKLRARPRGVGVSDGCEVVGESPPMEVDASEMELEVSEMDFLSSSVTLLACLVSTTEITEEKKVGIRSYNEFSFFI